MSQERTQISGIMEQKFQVEAMDTQTKRSFKPRRKVKIVHRDSSSFNQSQQEMSMTAEHLSLLKAAISRRYNPANNYLDLSYLKKDHELLSHNVVVDASKRSHGDALLQVIHADIPHVQCLDLAGNDISSLQALSQLPVKAPNLRVILLTNNDIRNEQDLDCLKHLLHLRELSLVDNPIRRKFVGKNMTEYMTAVQNTLPQITRLDGYDLAPVPVPMETVTTPNQTTRVKGVVPPHQRESAIHHFCNYTGMTQEFSIMCLSESGWNFAKAYQAYAMAKAAGRIPTQAFTTN